MTPDDDIPEYDNDDPDGDRYGFLISDDHDNIEDIEWLSIQED